LGEQTSSFTTESTEITEPDWKEERAAPSGPNPFFLSDLCTTNLAFLRKPRRFSTVSRQLQEAVVVAVVVAVAVVV